MTAHACRKAFASLALRGRLFIGADGRLHREQGNINAISEIGGWEKGSEILLAIYAKVDEEIKRETADIVNISLEDWGPLEVPDVTLGPEARA